MIKGSMKITATALRNNATSMTGISAITDFANPEAKANDPDEASTHNMARRRSRDAGVASRMALADTDHRLHHIRLVR
jgi:hypothetical protein